MVTCALTGLQRDAQLICPELGKLRPRDQVLFISNKLFVRKPKFLGRNFSTFKISGPKFV